MILKFNIKVFNINIYSFIEKIVIYPLKKTYIAIIWIEKVFILVKYIIFSHIFLKKLAKFLLGIFILNKYKSKGEKI